LSDNELTSSENFEVSKVTRLRCRVLRASICLQFLQALDTDKGKGKKTYAPDQWACIAFVNGKNLVNAMNE
jgi:hypothetical protein